MAAVRDLTVRVAGVAATTQLARAIGLLNDLVDPDPCWFDHNGGCQAHGFFDGPCAHAEARKFLAEMADGTVTIDPAGSAEVDPA